jgi:hypothetical protein
MFALMAAPPSVLPDISPSRGEICKTRSTSHKLVTGAEYTTFKRRKTKHNRISPLEGEMSGRTEGGLGPP